jgi:hypothetical protein
MLTKQGVKMTKLIENLINDDEKLYLEFKYKWYWENDSKGTEKEWGEFLKDFVALSNCNKSYVKDTKYLIIGINENEKNLEQRIINTDLSNKFYLSLNDLKNEILNKLNTYFRYGKDKPDRYINFDLKYHKIENKQILIFEIKPIKYLIILKKDLQDKKRTEKQNNVFIREYKQKDDPQVANASPEILIELESEIKQYRLELEREEKKEKGIEKTINLYLQENKMFSLKNPIKEKNWKENILFEIYPLKSDFINIDFIYIYNKTSQQKTFDYIKKNKLISEDEKRWVLIEEGLNKDIKGIKNKFLAEKVFPLDEFALEYLYKEYLEESIYHNGTFKQQQQIKNFVEPFTTEKNEKNAFILLTEWFKKQFNPLIVIKGYGGIGKTTLVKYFLDYIYNDYEQSKIVSKILFINSKDIINEISKKDNINNLYDFYDAFTKGKELAKKFNKELLELSIDNGNIIIVLDGIDEVIAKLGHRFDVDKFINTIYNNYSLGNQKTKIIITCRDYFWSHEINTQYQIKTIELKAFNEDLTKKFFQKQFNRNTKEFKQCMKLSKEFALSSNENLEKKEAIYIPYILDVIMDMVKQKRELKTINYDDIESNILKQGLTNDYFTGRICNREMEKLNNLEIDYQIQFFINLAIEFNGEAREASALKLFNGIPQQTNDIIEKFKGHPLIIYENNFFCFRYDFFQEYFINLYISDFFLKMNESKPITKELKEIITKYIRYDNNFTENICLRLVYNDDLKLYIISLIENIIIKIKNNDEDKDRELISSLIIILLVSLRLSNSENNIETRTNLLVEILGENFEYLSLIDIYGENTNIKMLPTFDFKNRIIKNVIFKNYEYFWECKINENTKLEHCTLHHLKPRDGIKIFDIHNNLFSKCDIDDTTNKFLHKKDKETNNKKENLRKKIMKIIKHFEDSGIFKEKKVEDTRSKCDTRVLDALTKNKIITPYKNPKKPTLQQYKIDDKYNDLIKIIEQGGTSVELEKILKTIPYE